MNEEFEIITVKMYISEVPFIQKNKLKHVNILIFLLLTVLHCVDCVVRATGHINKATTVFKAQLSLSTRFTMSVVKATVTTTERKTTQPLP